VFHLSAFATILNMKIHLSICLFFAAFTAANTQNMNHQTFDWQGHRGCWGLLPENSIPAFLKALEFPVTTLELDLAVSKDNRLIVSHEPWMSADICSKPDGSPVTKSEAMNLKIRDLTYEEIKNYDCGSRGNSRFPEQQAMKTHKPSLAEVVAEVKRYCTEKGKPMPRFNIEIKSLPEGDGIFTPMPEEFVKLVLDEINALKIKELTCIQSFDVRPLQVLKKLDPAVTIALLVENMDGVEKNLERLGFQPDIYSSYYVLLRKKAVKKLHEQGIKVIPWTVNSVKAMEKLRRWGVDGIITDYPNLIEAVK
ncbi:MAG: glycerophosphodiester phosphodiesterase family protein, partial [Bacteroidota bacterium]